MYLERSDVKKGDSSDKKYCTDEMEEFNKKDHIDSWEAFCIETEKLANENNLLFLLRRADGESTETVKLVRLSDDSFQLLSTRYSMYLHLVMEY